MARRIDGENARAKVNSKHARSVCLVVERNDVGPVSVSGGQEIHDVVPRGRRSEPSASSGVVEVESLPKDRVQQQTRAPEDPGVMTSVAIWDCDFLNHRAIDQRELLQVVGHLFQRRLGVRNQ